MAVAPVVAQISAAAMATLPLLLEGSPTARRDRFVDQVRESGIGIGTGASCFGITG